MGKTLILRTQWGRPLYQEHNGEDPYIKNTQSSSFHQKNKKLLIYNKISQNVLLISY